MFKILIVDDSKSVHNFVKSILNNSGKIEFASVFNGEEAIAAIASGQHFDLIFMDWEMPVLNGPATVQKLKSQNLKMPIIMMTTKNEPSDIELMLSYGVSEYMMKPFTADIAFEKIEFVCGVRFDTAA